ncbi:tetratricopeptide repeat protein [Planctomicrobium sp.]|nr:tetratricopeptide repeat protein [Planctomicrobium sp.]
MATADALLENAKASLKDKNVDVAIEHLEEAIKVDETHTEAHETLAGLCFIVKDYERAASLYKRVSVLDPKNVGALINSGAALNKKKDFKESVKTLRQALGKDRRCPETYYNLGIAERGLNHLAMAVSAYKEAIRLKPEFVEAISNLGNVLLEMKNHTQAITQFRKALEVRPDFKKAQKGLKKAEEASYQLKQSRDPFGRLVNMDEVEKKNQIEEKKIELTPQERFEDRDTVHKLAKESELLAIDLLAQIKEELSPAVLGITRLMTEEKNSTHWAQEQVEYQSAFRRFLLRLEKLKEKTDEIKKHEEKIQNKA